MLGLRHDDIRYDLIGMNSANVTAHMGDPAEVRARVAARTADAATAAEIGAEVEALYLNGPSGGGGVTTSLREVVAVASVLIGREAVSLHPARGELMRLRDIAHARTGDKGDTSQICVFARQPEHFALLERALTAQRVADHLTALKPRRIDRHVLPNLGAVNFVLHGALSGGVTRSLALDAHGKTLGSQLLDMEMGDA
jgi:hypothetical protein